MSIIRISTKGGNDHAVISPVVQKLLERSLLVRRPDGSMYTEMTEEQLTNWVAELGVCDFCNETQPKHVIDVPDFDIPMGLDPGKNFKPFGNQISTGGWAACDECHALIKTNRRPELLRRAIERASVGKFGAAAIKELHHRFWQAYDDQATAAGIAAALNDYIEDQTPNYTALMTDKDRRVESIKRLTGLTTDEVDALNRHDLSYKDTAKKLVAWQKKFGTDYEGARRLAELIETQQLRPPVVGAVPHWQRALDQKFEILKFLTKALTVTTNEVHLAKGTDLGDSSDILRTLEAAARMKEMTALDFRTDVKQLRSAETYSFNQETVDAIFAGSRSIPRESPLSSVDVPTGCGWFWFANPIDVASSPVASSRTHALLWGWDDDKIPNETIAQLTKNSTVALRFSAYVQDERDSNTSNSVLPSTRWYWPLELTFDEMIAFNTEAYAHDYGPGGQHEHDPNRIRLEGTIKCITELSLFFLMSCVWFKQRIAVVAPAHVERHAKKRYIREHRLTEKEAPSVKVIALRRNERSSDVAKTPVLEGESKALREYSYRWIVAGHNRLQACGPERKYRRLIWIDPYPKGPEDKPLKTHQKVYAVVR